MTEQDFILLVEEYFDNSITEDGRMALRREIGENPERKRLFELQARQHVRLHAQTSRCDFTESQRVAAMVVDIARKTRSPLVYDYVHPQSLRERIKAVICGFRAPRGSTQRRYAREFIGRVIGAPAVSLAVNLAIIGLLMYFAIPRADEWSDQGRGVITLGLPQESPPTLDRNPPETGQPGEPSGAEGMIANAPVTLSIRETAPAPEPGLGVSGIPIETAIPAAPMVTPLATGIGGTPMSLPGILQGRLKPQRPKLIKEGGGEGTEDAVTRALVWLRQQQREDGSWEGQDKAAMAGLSLLAFLGRNETIESPDFGATVRKGLDYLLRVQDAQGRFSADVYAHAISTYAVSEAYTLTRIIALRDSMERAVAVIINGQQPGGGFNYKYEKGARFDTSVTGWQVQALKAARLAGSAQPGLDQALNRSIWFLQNESFARDGSGFVYCGVPGVQPAGGSKPSMTAVGTLCLQLLGQGRSVHARAGLKALESSAFDWPAGDKKVGVYAAYYLTQAKFQQESTAVWKKWNQEFKTTMLRHQKKDGHWEGGDYDQGSHVYTTALCTLTLEVYYRCLRTYMKEPDIVNAANISTDGVPVEVR